MMTFTALRSSGLRRRRDAFARKIPLPSGYFPEGVLVDDRVELPPGDAVCLLQGVHVLPGDTAPTPLDDGLTRGEANRSRDFCGARFGLPEIGPCALVDFEVAGSAVHIFRHVCDGTQWMPRCQLAVPRFGECVYGL